MFSLSVEWPLEQRQSEKRKILEKNTVVNIVGVEVQTGMTLDGAGEEAMGLGRVEMVVNGSAIKATSNATSVTSLVIIAMSVPKGKR